MYRLAVCEDETVLREALCAQCDNILTQLKVEHEIAAFQSAEELEKALAVGMSFDMMCLDILLTGKSGLELALEIRQRDEKTSIIFITGSTEFLLEGYSARPIQYLLKPVSKEALEKALRTDLRIRHKVQTVTVQAGGKTAVLQLSDIRYVESQNHGVMFHTKQDEQFFWMSLSQIEKLLPSEQFCRCHNSFLVNLEEIKEMGRREICLKDGSCLAVGRRYAEQFQHRFIRYLNKSV